MKQRLKLFLITVISFGWVDGGLFAQKKGQARIDSLLQELPKTKEDTNGVNILNALSFTFIWINADEGLKYGQFALALATKIADKKGMANAYVNLGLSQHNRSELEKAMENYLKALKMQEELGNKQGIGAVNTNIGNVFLSKSDYAMALEHYLKALKIGEESANKSQIAKNDLNIGTVYFCVNDYTRSLEYYLKALKAYEESGDKQNVITALSYTANAYVRQNNFTEALDHYFRSLKMAEDIGDTRSIATNTGNIGAIFMSQKKYADAISYLLKALMLSERINDIYVKAGIMQSIGETYITMVKDTAIWVGGGHSIGNYVASDEMPGIKAEVLQRASDYLQQALTISMALHAQGLMQSCYEDLAEVYKHIGDYKKAVEYADNARQIKDSVFTKEKNDKIVKLELDRIYDKKTADLQKASELKLLRQKSFTYAGIAGILLLACFSFFIIKERRKSEKLLLNILPSEVASELKSKGVTKAKYYDNVTVLFTDFVNFTSAGERMSPQALIDELHNCFKAFDEITSKYNIEKIKTIGDAYLAVAGLPTADTKHAEHIMMAAIEMRAFMKDRAIKLGNETFEMRIGIHTGSAVAGIVGVKKFAYDIWGDTVNTAARMEQKSEAGKINISDTTYALIKDKFACEYRGEIEAKNKGRMKMYFVS